MEFTTALTIIDVDRGAGIMITLCIYAPELTYCELSSAAAAHGDTVPNKTMEDICLKNDNGEALSFQGRLFSECSHFDEESGCLTRQQLYITDSGEQVYYVIRSSNQEKSRHAYKLSVQGDSCVINNGHTEIALKFDMLMLAVRSLCGLNADALPPLAMVEEMLKAANG